MKIPDTQSDKVSEARKWLARRVRDLRKSAGLTQRELSNRMEIHHTRVSDLERNKSDFQISTILRVAWALGLTLSELTEGCPRHVTLSELQTASEGQV